MAGRLISQHPTGGGQRVLVEEYIAADRTVFYATDCTGCTAGGIESTRTQPADTALTAAETWAKRHAASCRRQP